MSPAQTTPPPTVWDRVVCGIDFTPAGLQAALLAARLMPACAELTLCTVADDDFSPEAIESGLGLFLVDKTIMRKAKDALTEVQSEVHAIHNAKLHTREGAPIPGLLDELSSTRATLVALGGHGHSRAAGIVLGSVATAMLHRAPCSVLIAHATPQTDTRGDAELIVGFDGSDGAYRALATGRELAERLSLKLRAIEATSDQHPPGPDWSRDELGPDVAVSEDPRTPVEALLDASTTARLLIIGSRHLSGLPALSSVSERVAHQASCPVLVIR